MRRPGAVTAPASTLSTRVLIVEDYKPTQELIAELLSVVGGFEVVGQCTTENAALEWLHDEESSFDLLILDLVLREGSGFTILSNASAARASDVIVFSDFASPAVAGKCRDMGAYEAVPKADV